MNIDFFFASLNAAYIRNIPVNTKLEDAVSEFVKLNPDFKGKLIAMKDTKYNESDGSKHQKYYDYDIEWGKYRKHSYVDDRKWKTVKIQK